MSLKEIAQYHNFFIDYNCTLKEALGKMNLNGNGSVVLLQQRTPVAILTQSDIIRALGEQIDLTMQAYQFANKLLVYIYEESSFEFAVKLLNEHDIRRLVLVDKEHHFSGVILQEILFQHMDETIFQQEVQKQVAKRLEQEYLFMQQTKLATMGEMIGHIAHQWRQPLTQLSGLLMNFAASYEFGQLDQKHMNQLIKEGNELIKYMSTTIEDFRNFFTPGKEKEEFELSQAIQRAVNIISATLNYFRIELEIMTPSEPIILSGYPSELGQVILNLLDNAKDILVEREIKSPKITITTRLISDRVQLCIEDNAGGIDEAILDKIFDIYFTTKTKRGGSGLGLYISKLIIERKGLGEISVTNSTLGASFTILLQINNNIQ